MMAPTPGPVLEPLNPISIESRDSAGFLVLASNSAINCSNTKGLLNMPGQNNCFLNSAVQVLWHLDSFRRSFRDLSEHACMAESCIFCALKELFTQFQYSQESALPPDALRHALAKTFCDQRRFQLGFMDDAAECFENILLRIHVHISNDHEDMCRDLRCIPHRKFAMTLVEQSICHNCNAMSEPLPFMQMVHYVTTSALCSKASDMEHQGYCVRNHFGTLLQLAGNVGENRECSSGCGSKITVKKTLMNFPEIVSIGLVWDSESPSLQHITDVLHCIGTNFQLKDMFHGAYENDRTEKTYHQLVGIVTYYGKHYSTFFFHSKLHAWIYFDDAAVREIGPSWEMVVEKCQKGRFQPLLLLFANPQATSVPASMNDTGLFSSQKHSINNCSHTGLSEKQTVIQKYLMMQNKYENEIMWSNYRKNVARMHLNRDKPEANFYAVPSVVDPKGYSSSGQSCIKQVPIYCNTNAYVMGTESNMSSSAKNHIYSNVHSDYRVDQNSTDCHVITDLYKANEVCLPPALDSKCSPRYENLDVYQPISKEVADSSKDSDSAFTDDPENDTYINRKTVENVLNLQKLQRQAITNQSYIHSAVGNRNSSSSLESFDNPHCLKLNLMQKTNRVLETVGKQNAQRRDSGNWSGDRNSSSSNTSTENPFLAVISSKRLLCGPSSSQSKRQGSDLASTNSSDHGYDSYSVSSSDSFPSINNSPVKLEPRLKQIPEDWNAQDFNKDLDKKLKLITEDTSGPPDCDRLCAEADLLLAKSHEKEKEGDLVMAALLSDTAAARARAAMDAPYNNSRSLVSAKMKHSTCVMRSSCLYRKLKDGEGEDRRKSKGHHSRQSSRDSTHSRHSRQGSRENMHSKHAHKDYHCQTTDDIENFGKNIEIYGTLPKKGSKKKRCTSPATPQMKDNEVYQDFLDKQRKNIGSTAVHTDQSSLKIFQDSTKIRHVSSSEKFQASIEPSSPRPGSSTQKKLEKCTKNAKDETNNNSLRKLNKNCSSGELSITLSTCNSDQTNDETRSPDIAFLGNSPDKKQHKIKRKLMGGFMKRKNRSLPDLRADELSDDFDQSVDSSRSTVAALTLPNDTLKMSESKPALQVATINRGFHQPHYAFVKKDLVQKPHLLKVNPPNVQVTPQKIPVPKQVNILQSVPKKIADLKDKREPTADHPSRIPLIKDLNKRDSSISFLSSENGRINDTKPCLTQPTASSIPIYNKNSAAEVKVLEPETPNDLKLSMGQELQQQASNSFLAEIQAKRKEIVSRKAVGIQENSKETMDQKMQHHSLTMESTSQLPKLTPNSGGSSLLKELQSKQQQLCLKQTRALSTPLKQEQAGKASKNIDYVTEKNAATKACDQSITTKVVDGSKASSAPYTFTKSVTAEPPASKTGTSVKDLATKFESILVLPKDKVDNNAVALSATVDEQICESSESHTSNHQHNAKSSVSNHVPLNEDSETSRKSSVISTEVATSEILFNRETCQLKSDRAPTLNNLHQNRPQHPPDYETAMQRLEYIRCGSTSLPNGPALDEKQRTINEPQRKKSSKKTVTFSDEVVLVACAEFDDSGFFSNPLLERVYQKHIESGGRELPDLKPSTTTYSRERYCDSQNLCPELESAVKSEPNSSDLIPCNLCHNRFISNSSIYCTDCAFYMSKYQ